MGEDDWAAMAAHAELEGEVLLGFVTESVTWADELRGGGPGSGSSPVRRILDIGSGPGVGTCELARLFPSAEVTAVDGSPAMIEAVRRRAAVHGLADRISTHQAELPGGLDEWAPDPVDLIWASMSLHHVGDEVGALREVLARLAPGGVLVIAEGAEPARYLPDGDIADRLAEAESRWYEAMRAGLPGSVPSSDLASMVEAAGGAVLGSRTARLRHDPPVSSEARQFAVGRVRRTRDQLADFLDEQQRAELDALVSEDDPRSVALRADVFVEASRQIVVAGLPAQALAPALALDELAVGAGLLASCATSSPWPRS
jgi:SAM-dependent methyltransferase